MWHRLWIRTTLVLVGVVSLPTAPILPAYSGLVAAQVPFEQAVHDLASADPATRLRTVQMLKQAAYPDAAIPLASLIRDQQDEIQLEAIAAELNIFTADLIVANNRRGFAADRRQSMSAESVFSAGPLAIGTRPVPSEVLTALRSGVYFENPRVCIEAVYALGVLGAEPDGRARRELLRATGPDLATLAGASNSDLRHTAVRVIGRLFARRPDDGPIETTVGDAVVVALNDNDRAVRVAAMQALGTMQYERGVEALIVLFRYYGKGEPAEAALDALARIAHPSSAPLLATQLLSSNAALRGIAIEGLARLGDPSKLADIRLVLNREGNAGVALAGAFALASLGNASTDRIAGSLTRPKLREQAKQYLIELAPGRAPAFARHLLNPSEQIRFDVVDALGLSGDPAAIPVVEPLTKDRDPRVARAAERAVARLRRATANRPTL